jgi:hypothetical protein
MARHFIDIEDSSRMTAPKKIVLAYSGGSRAATPA